MCHQQLNSPRGETHTHTHKVVDYITHWPLGTPVNIIDSHRIPALPRGLLGRILFPLCLPLSLPASLPNPSFTSFKKPPPATFKRQKYITQKTNSSSIQMLRYTCGTKTGQAFRSHATHWTRQIPSQCARDAEMWKTTWKDVKWAWCHANKVVNSTDNTPEQRSSGRGDSPTDPIYYKLACSNEKYTPWSTCCTHIQAHKRGWNKHAITSYKALSSRARLRWGKCVIVFH